MRILSTPILFGWLFPLALFSSAAQTSSTNPPPAIVTTLYSNARIYTNDPGKPWADTLAVRDEKILAVGTEREVLAMTGEKLIIVDLGGRFVMPGFNDAHVHLGLAGQDFLLGIPIMNVPSLAELQQRVKEAATKRTEGEWITGFGWDQEKWVRKEFPTRQQLDAVSPKNPVLLENLSGHAKIANSLALKLAGVTKDTPDPPGGKIERDATGEPTGILKEDPAMNLVAALIPPPTMEQRRRGIEFTVADATRSGVTSVQDNSDWEDFLVFRQLKNERKLTVRITEWLWYDFPLETLEARRREGGTMDPWLKTGAIKFVADGALRPRSAALLAPYSDEPSNSGFLILQPEELRERAIAWDKAGFQLAFHAVGDRGTRVVLDVFEAVANANGPRDRRDRVEHAWVVAPEDFPRFAKLNVIASMQPASTSSNDGRWSVQRVGPIRAKGVDAVGTMLKNGVHVALGTDYNGEPFNPMRGLFACVTRESLDDGPKSIWQPEERLTLADCIRAYTSGSAYAEFEDGKKGELKTGEYADFVVLSNDLTKVPPAEYLKTEVLVTVVGGHVMYQKK
jgi:predicted amidohydrolase YtcJ